MTVSAVCFSSVYLHFVTATSSLRPRKVRVRVATLFVVGRILGLRLSGPTTFQDARRFSVGLAITCSSICSPNVSVRTPNQYRKFCIGMGDQEDDKKQ